MLAVFAASDPLVTPANYLSLNDKDFRLRKSHTIAQNRIYVLMAMVVPATLVTLFKYEN